MHLRCIAIVHLGHSRIQASPPRSILDCVIVSIISARQGGGNLACREALNESATGRMPAQDARQRHSSDAQITAACMQRQSQDSSNSRCKQSESDAQAEHDVGSHRAVHQADMLRHRCHGVLQSCVRQLQQMGPPRSGVCGPDRTTCHQCAEDEALLGYLDAQIRSNKATCF
jgi:hypothetical protein